MSERQWGTVQEDYSADGNAWDYLPHDHARSRAYRWGENGLAGFCDIEQRPGFGALAVGRLLPHVTWQIVAYAVLSLTLVRMVPVAIAMLGTGRSPRPSPSSDGSVLAAWPPSCSH